MSRYFNRYWVAITIIISVVFTVLFYPVAAERAGNPETIGLTIAGLAVIWIVYVIRAMIFSRTPSRRNKYSK